MISICPICGSRYKKRHPLHDECTDCWRARQVNEGTAFNKTMHHEFMDRIGESVFVESVSPRHSCYRCGGKLPICAVTCPHCGAANS